MRWFFLIGLSAGVTALCAFLAYSDTSMVFSLITSMGWGIMAVIAVRATIILICGIGWFELIRSQVSLPLSVFIFVRWLRESINVLLPVAQMGGDLVGGRLLTFWKVPGGMAGASVLVDLLLQAFGQLLFALLGCGVLVKVSGGNELAGWVIATLPIGALALVAFFAAQRFGLFRLVEKLLEKIGERWPKASFGRDLGLHDAIVEIYSRPRAVARSMVWHIFGWLAGIAEIWIALSCLGYTPNLAEAVVLESLSQAIRGAVFFVPGGLGVQEGGFLVLGHIFGISPEAALALSLIKRIPDVALSLPGLVTWNVVEAKRMFRPSQGLESA